MTPAARIAAAAEILAELDHAPAPADAVLANYLKARRFIGAKDRAAIAELLYGILRRRARLDWHLEQAGAAPSARTRMIAELALAQHRSPAEIAALFGGSRYAAPPLDAGERRLLGHLAGRRLEPPEMPERVRVECPDWAETPLRALFGPRFAEELAALNRPAPLDLRANALKADRETVRAALAAEGIVATPTPFSPWGLRVEGRPPLSATRAFREGLVEVQDEGSQLLASLVDARPGMQVVDFCAGAGGKTLALAATMANKGRIVACDVSARRLEQAGRRLRRAGVHNAERRTLSSERDPWVKRHKGQFDRVLVDAPCSGTGTWRRNPDARWGRGGPDLAELTALQAKILDSAARLVRPGGRLVYGTCSLLRAENEEQVAAFLAAHPDVASVPAATLLPGLAGDFLRLTPARHGTDGFFAAILERRPEAAAPAEQETSRQTVSSIS